MGCPIFVAAYWALIIRGGTYRLMSTTITVLHIQRQGPVEVERALEAIFAGEERTRALRLEGTYSAVLARALDSALDAGYRYLILRPRLDSTWTPLLELGNRAVGLDVELSRILGGCAVFTAFVYGDVLSGYRLTRDGALVDEYLSDPTYLADEDDPDDGAPLTPDDVEAARGRPELFSDLLPEGTTPADFARVVLRPGWWEEHDAGTVASAETDDEDEEEIVDEADRMRCIGLALELWEPSEYPFAQDPEEIANKVVGPAIALAFA